MKKNNKRIVMMASIILIMVVAVSGVVAWLFTNTNTVANTFTPGAAPNVIKETMSGTTKSDVYIQVPNDPKNVPVYIRATYVVTWQNGNDMLPDKPVKDVDYTITMGTSNKWVTFGDYFYYTEVVNPGSQTENFIDKVEVKAAAPMDGYTLNVEILSQSIQADGVNNANEKPVQLAWGVTITEPNAENPTGAVEPYSPTQP